MDPLDVDIRDGTTRPTGIQGTPWCRSRGSSDFADDAGSFVVWDDFGSATAVLVELAGARHTPVPVGRDPTASPASGRSPAAPPSCGTTVW